MVSVWYVGLFAVFLWSASAPQHALCVCIHPLIHSSDVMRLLLSHFNSINTDNYYCTWGIGQELVTKHTLIYCHTLLLVEVSNYALGGWAGGGSVFHLEQFIESACIHRQVHMIYCHLMVLNYLDSFDFSSCIWCNALECDGTIFFAPTAFYKLCANRCLCDKLYLQKE